jgi:hypothetical protein
LVLSVTVDKIILNNGWNPATIAPFLPNEIIMHISSMPLPLEPRGDEFIWGLIGNDKFTMKSASDLQTANVASHTYSNLLTCFWKLNFPPKVKIFSRLLIYERLKTKQRIHTFTNSIPASCVFCTNHDKS